jgi:hypothetical protein
MKDFKGALSGAVPNAKDINPYGETQESVAKYTEDTEKSLKALEDRYSQPNWFKVAAGFAKPQLGGFLASLGSASEAMGENVEQQRQLAVPLAEARAKLAVYQNQMGHKVKASSKIEEYQKKYPGAPLPPYLITEQTLHDPEKGAILQKNLQSEIELTRQKREFLDQQLKAGAISPEQYQTGLKDLATSASILSTNPNVAPGAPKPLGGAGNTDVAPPPAVDAGKQTDKPAEKILLTTPGSNTIAANPTTQAGNERYYKMLDEQGESHIKELSHLASDLSHGKTMRPIKDVLRYSDDPRFNNVMAILSGNGVLSGLGALIENGVHVSAAEFNASLAIPLSKIALAIKDEKEQAFAQNVYRALAQIELNNQRSIGLNPNSARNAEFSLLSNAAAHPDTLPSAARLYAKQSELGQLRNRDMYTDIQKIMRDNHPTYKLDTHSPNKSYLVATSPSQKKIMEQYDRALDAELEKYLKETGGGKK